MRVLEIAENDNLHKGTLKAITKSNKSKEREWNNQVKNCFVKEVQGKGGSSLPIRHIKQCPRR